MKAFFIFLFACIITDLFAQSSNEPIIANYGNLMTINFSGLQEKKIGQEGTEYIYDDWTPGKAVTFSKEEIANYLLRYDLKNRQLEINYNNQIKVLPSFRILYFELDINGVKRIFFNTLNFKNGSAYDGFFEIKYHGEKISLYKKTELSLQKAQYVAALDAGNPNDRLVKKVAYYYLKENNLYPLGKNKKAILANFPGKAVELEQFVKANKINFKEENDLLKFIEYYNSI